MQRLVSLFYFKFDTMDKTRINDYLQEVFSSLGDRLSGDDFFFKFAGKSGYVRLVPNKPAKVGLWNFQGAIFFEMGTSLFGLHPYTYFTPRDPMLHEMH